MQKKSESLTVLGVIFSQQRVENHYFDEFFAVFCCFLYHSVLYSQIPLLRSVFISNKIILGSILVFYIDSLSSELSIECVENHNFDEYFVVFRDFSIIGPYIVNFHCRSQYLLLIR